MIVVKLTSRCYERGISFADVAASVNDHTAVVKNLVSF